MAKVIALSEAAAIALHSIVLIARSEGKLNVENISEQIQTSRHHVAKVLQRLVKDNFLNSVRGPSGGFSLKKKPEEMNLLQIYESVEGKIAIADCPLEKPVCPFNKCIINNVTKKMSTDFRDYLESQTLDKYL